MLSAAQRDIVYVSLLWTSTHAVPAVAKQLQTALLSGCAFGKPDSVFFFIHDVVFFFCLVREWHNKIWMRNMAGALAAPCLRGPGGAVKTIRLLTAVPSWDAEGQMVCSQQVITASMLIHWHPHKWVTRATWSTWDAGILPSSACLWGFFYWVWHQCCAVEVVGYEKKKTAQCGYLLPFLERKRFFYS